MFTCAGFAGRNWGSSKFHCKITLLPGEIWKLQKLEHIYLHEDTVLTYMPSGFSHLTSIRTLGHFFVGKGIGCKLNELNGLIHLKGLLRIFNLENVSSARDCVEANLKGKHNLARLHLVWNDEGVNRVKIDFDVLGNLEPHQNLKALVIKGYRDNRFPRWMMDPLLPNLVVIALVQCRNCQNLPALGQLPSLKEVHLEELDALQLIEGGSVVRRQREWFPSLKRIFLFSNPNLESWVKEEEEEVSLHSVVLLSVSNCPKLSTMPMLPSLEQLTIEKCSEKLMLSLLKVNPEKNAPTSSLPNSSSLANLKYLDISSCDDLLSLSEDGLQNLASLETLNIQFCPRMVSLPEQGLGGLTSLVSLKISDCESLASLSGMRYLTALQNLHLAHCEKMHILEDDMDGLTSLRTLEIEEIPNLLSRHRQHSHSSSDVKPHHTMMYDNSLLGIGRVQRVHQMLWETSYDSRSKCFFFLEPAFSSRRSATSCTLAESIHKRLEGLIYFD
ncbi:hypothetical protein IFM89_010533 [Coptis chinensis]|uniref:R13L1/DRL21-like LRR repeat region domain-containing protein n=1 Tax=Coptis chinensis TaxID=261450 RepID=A0A835HX27_9MAGN|nr:hypothetical protein IFM89_010533 [Coptis chinensis]